MTMIPNSGAFTSSLTGQEAIDLLNQFTDAAREMPGGSDIQSVTVNSGAISNITSWMLRLDTEGAAPTDDLNYVQGPPSGRFLILMAESALRVVTLKHSTSGTGTMSMADLEDYELTGSRWIAFFRKDGAWVEFARYIDSVFTPGQTIYTASGTFVVPTGVTQVWVTAVGGGGGGGGGAGNYGNPTGNGVNGSSGGTTSFGAYVSVAGGGGGGYGIYTGRGGNPATNGGTGTPASTLGFGGNGGSGAYTLFGSRGSGGNGGQGGNQLTGALSGGGGGGGGTSASAAVRKLVAVTPGESIAVTIGAGGAGGAGGPGYVPDPDAGNTGANGVAGQLIVEW